MEWEYLLNRNFRPIYPKHYAQLSINKVEQIYVLLKYFFLKIYYEENNMSIISLKSKIFKNSQLTLIQ